MGAARSIVMGNLFGTISYFVMRYRQIYVKYLFIYVSTCSSIHPIAEDIMEIRKYIGTKPHWTRVGTKAQEPL